MDDLIYDLLAKQQIHEILLRYCRGIDRLDTALVRSCYHDDAEDDHGMFQGGPDDFVVYALRGLSSMTSTQHCLHNVLIEVYGDAAVSEAYCVAYHRTPSSKSDSADHTVGLRYVDRFERRSSGPWLIARRTVVYEWTRVDPVHRQWGLGDNYARGRRGEDDPLYEELRRLRAVTPGG